MGMIKRMEKSEESGPDGRERAMNCDWGKSNLWCQGVEFAPFHQAQNCESISPALYCVMANELVSVNFRLGYLDTLYTLASLVF